MDGPLVSIIVNDFIQPRQRFWKWLKNVPCAFWAQNRISSCPIVLRMPYAESCVARHETSCSKSILFSSKLYINSKCLFFSTKIGPKSFWMSPTDVNYLKNVVSNISSKSVLGILDSGALLAKKSEKKFSFFVFVIKLSLNTINFALLRFET